VNICKIKRLSTRLMTNFIHFYFFKYLNIYLFFYPKGLFVVNYYKYLNASFFYKFLKPFKNYTNGAGTVTKFYVNLSKKYQINYIFNYYYKLYNQNFKKLSILQKNNFIKSNLTTGLNKIPLLNSNNLKIFNNNINIKVDDIVVNNNTVDSIIKLMDVSRYNKLHYRRYSKKYIKFKRNIYYKELRFLNKNTKKSTNNLNNKNNLTLILLNNFILKNNKINFKYIFNNILVIFKNYYTKFNLFYFKNLTMFTKLTFFKYYKTYPITNCNKKLFINSKSILLLKNNKMLSLLMFKNKSFDDFKLLMLFYIRLKRRLKHGLNFKKFKINALNLKFKLNNLKNKKWKKIYKICKNAHWLYSTMEWKMGNTEKYESINYNIYSRIPHNLKPKLNTLYTHTSPRIQYIKLFIFLFKKNFKLKKGLNKMQNKLLKTIIKRKCNNRFKTALNNFFKKLWFKKKSNNLIKKKIWYNVSKYKKFKITNIINLKNSNIFNVKPRYRFKLKKVFIKLLKKLTKNKYFNKKKMIKKLIIKKYKWNYKFLYKKYFKFVKKNPKFDYMYTSFNNQRNKKYNYLLQKRQYKPRVRLQSFRQFYKKYKPYKVAKVKLNFKKKNYFLLNKKITTIKKIFQNYIKELNVNGVSKINSIKNQKVNSKKFKANRFWQKRYNPFFLKHKKNIFNRRLNKMHFLFLMSKNKKFKNKKLQINFKPRVLFVKNDSIKNYFKLEHKIHKKKNSNINTWLSSFTFSKKRLNVINFYKNWFKNIFKQYKLNNNLLTSLKNLNTKTRVATIINYSKYYTVNFVRLFDIKFIKTTYTVNKLIEGWGSSFENWKTFFIPKLWYFIFLTTFTSLIKKYNIWQLRQQLTDYHTNNYKFRYPNVYLKPAFFYTYESWYAKRYLDESNFLNRNVNKNFKLFSKFKNNKLINDHIYTLPYKLKKLIRRNWYKSPRRYLFKHHYWKILKKERAKVNTYFCLFFRYQHRMTRYLFRFKLTSVTNIFRHISCLLVNIFVKSHLASSYEEFKFLLKNNCLYLNGLLIKNKNIPVYSGDVIALTVNWYMFKYLKLVKCRLKNQKIQKFRYFYNVVMKQELTDQVLHKYQKKNIIYKYQDVPYFLETDLTTLTSIMILNPSIHYLFANNYWTFNQIYWFSLFQLNWKYIV